MLCALSGEAPQVPVASRKSGNVFEKRLIEQHIAEHHTDPVTGEDLEVEDLIDLKNPRIQRPRPPTFTSIPSLLAAFQTEWDAIALETFELSKQLAQTRQELSTALYQNDAATRVVARLTKERDDARSAMQNISVSGGGATNGDVMQVDGQELPGELVAKVQSTQATLSSTRRKRPLPEGWATAEEIATFDTTTASDTQFPGSQVLALDSTGDLAIIGGSDGSTSVYSISSKSVVHALKTDGSATAALWWNNKAVVATSTGSIHVFGDGAEVGTLSSHAGPVTSISLHPSGDILASTGVDKSYVLYDLPNMRAASQITNDSELLCSEFHPDGHLFTAGAQNGQIKVWTTDNGAFQGAFDAEGPIQDLSFSENGTWLAAAVKGQTTVDIWDLRKMASIKTIEVGSPIESLNWEYTAQFLAVGGPGGVSIQQYSKSGKSWSEPFKKAVSARVVQWGPEAKSLVTLTPEGALNVLGS